MHVALDVSGAGMKFEAGDAMSLSPSNEPALVDGLLERLGVSGDTCAPKGHACDMCDLFGACWARAAGRFDLAVFLLKAAGFQKLSLPVEACGFLKAEPL